MEGRHKNPLFYTDDGMVASLGPICLCGVFNTLVRLFDRVGMKKNVRKIVIMVYYLCQATGTQS